MLNGNNSSDTEQKIAPVPLCPFQKKQKKKPANAALVPPFAAFLSSPCHASLPSPVKSTWQQLVNNWLYNHCVHAAVNRHDKEERDGS